MNCIEDISRKNYLTDIWKIINFVLRIERQSIILFNSIAFLLCDHKCVSA